MHEVILDDFDVNPLRTMYEAYRRPDQQVHTCRSRTFVRGTQQPSGPSVSNIGAPVDRASCSLLTVRHAGTYDHVSRVLSERHLLLQEWDGITLQVWLPVGVAAFLQRLLDNEVPVQTFALCLDAALS